MGEVVKDINKEVGVFEIAEQGDDYENCDERKVLRFFCMDNKCKEVVNGDTWNHEYQQVHRPVSIEYQTGHKKGEDLGFFSFCDEPIGYQHICKKEYEYKTIKKQGLVIFSKLGIIVYIKKADK